MQNHQLALLTLAIWLVVLEIFIPGQKAWGRVCGLQIQDWGEASSYEQMMHGSTVNWNTVQLTYKIVPYEWMNNVQTVWDSPISQATTGTWNCSVKI